MDSPIDSNYDVIINQVESKKTILLRSLLKYWTFEKKEILNSILRGKTVLSLRIIDWFVTNYSKTDKIRYLHNGVYFTVYEDYKNQLKAYSKKLFDPFCRRERIDIDYVGKTTIGQLNFFKWAIESNIITWAIDHCKEIETNMVKVQLNRSPKIQKPVKNKNNFGKEAKEPKKPLPSGFVRQSGDAVVSFS
jgi:hypothetical protein